MIRVFVIEDNPTAVVAGLKNLFRSVRDGITISGFAENIKNAITSGEADGSDLFLMDLILGTSDPVVNIRKLKKRFPGKPIVVYTQNASVDWMKIMADEGAMGFISKHASRDDLKNAIERAISGETGFSSICGSSDDENDFAGFERTNSILMGIEKEIILEYVKSNGRKYLAEKFRLSRWEVGKKIKNIRLRVKASSDLEMIKILTELKEI